MCRVPADSLLRDTQTKKGGGAKAPDGRTRQHLSTNPTCPQIAGKYKKNPALRKQNEPPHAQRWRGEEKRGSKHSPQTHSKNHMTQINHRRQPPHAAPGTISPIAPHGSRLLGLLPSTRLPYVKSSTTQPARRNKHRRPQQRHSLSTERLTTSRRP